MKVNSVIWRGHTTLPSIFHEYCEVIAYNRLQKEKQQLLRFFSAHVIRGDTFVFTFVYYVCFVFLFLANLAIWEDEHFVCIDLISLKNSTD